VRVLIREQSDSVKLVFYGEVQANWRARARQAGIDAEFDTSTYNSAREISCTVYGTKGGAIVQGRKLAEQVVPLMRPGEMPDLTFDDAPAPKPAQHVDPKLHDRKALAQRKAAGEHICTFCGHSEVCLIQPPRGLIVIISGCSSFDPRPLTPTS